MSSLPFAVFELKEYMIIFRQLEIAEFNGVQAKIRALVRCTGIGLQDPQNEYRLDIYFLANDSEFPSPVVNVAERNGAIFFPMADMPILTDVIRNEKPIYGHLRGDHPHWTGITTTNEPIGAGDEDF